MVIYRDRSKGIYRNKLKADYAARYAEWLRRGKPGPAPERGDLSYMAAQAIRLDLRETHETALRYAEIFERGPL